MVATPAIALTRVHHRALYPRAYAGPDYAWHGAYAGPAYNVTTIPAGPHTGYRYSGPYDERIITQPNGIVIGTDPDPNIRAYMRRDDIGPNGTRGTGHGR
jgi:hypothetical protein